VPLNHLPNSPLVEAVFEIRFSGEPAVLSRMDEFYGLVREEYPQVFVPNPDPGVPNALLNWQLRDEAEQRFIGFNINSFSFHVLNYLDYQDFRSAALPLAERFCEVFKIRSLKRIGTRYVNSIVILRSEDGTIPVRNYLNFGFDLPKIVPAEEIEDIHVQFASRMGKGRLRTVIQHIRGQINEPERLLFDLDYSLDRSISREKLDVHMDKSHACIEDVFKGFVADSYMRFMKGDTL